MTYDERVEVITNICNQMENKVICPVCTKYPETLGQELVLLGDNYNTLFCPHCEMYIRVLLVAEPNM